MMTLRQIEVVRAIMVTGTIAGAAQLLNVSAPGISRLMKHTENMLGLRLFERKQGRYVPTAQAHRIFDQINTVYGKIEDLRYVISRLEAGESQDLRIGSVPSISNVMVPRAIERVRRKHPSLLIDINILKIEECIDYILLGKGEVVAMSHKFDHPSISFTPLASGELYCIVPMNHPLASRRSITAREIVKHPLIGIDPNDPYGRIMANIFGRHGLSYDITIRARFGSTVCALVKAGLGIAVIDQFTVAHDAVPGIHLLEIEEPTQFQTYIAARAGVPLSSFAESFVRLLRAEMQAVVRTRKKSGRR